MRDTSRRRFLRHLACGATAAALPGSVGRALCPGSRPVTEKPNFLFILIDDLGWMDLGYYGSTFHETPIIDQMAREGARFTDAYSAAPVCSPTRASIMTGKYPARLHLTDFIPGHRRPWAKLTVPKFRRQLPVEEMTIAKALQTTGYVSTTIGKWHLGGRRPTEYGFDQFVFSNQDDNDKRVGRFTGEALRFMERYKDRPFFLFLSHDTVHIPLEANEELIAKYKAKLNPGHVQRNAVYAAMIEALDDSVGRLLKKLDELEIADRTVVIFTSDNGGLIQKYTGSGPVVTSNAPLRSEKGTLYEGGIRVPLIVRWPRVVKPDSVCNVPVSSVDFYPTILDLAGVEGASGHSFDGTSLVPLLKQTGQIERDAIYWHYPHYHHTAPCGAIRQGVFKLIEFYEDGRLELYNLEADIGETNNLADKEPTKAAALRKKLSDWRGAVDAQMPTLNPNHDPAKAHEWG